MKIGEFSSKYAVVQPSCQSKSCGEHNYTETLEKSDSKPIRTEGCTPAAETHNAQYLPRSVVSTSNAVLSVNESDSGHTRHQHHRRGCQQTNSFGPRKGRRGRRETGTRSRLEYSIQSTNECFATFYQF